MIKGNLDSLEAWLYKWRLKINAKKKMLHCLYQDVDFDFRINGERIPFNPNPMFLCFIFDEYLSFITIIRSFEKEL